MYLVTLDREEQRETYGSWEVNPEHLIWLAGVDEDLKTIKFFTASGKTFTAPFSAFPTSGDGTAPDFTKASLIDYGNTIKLGEYEASSKAIIDEYLNK